jgi:two-component system, OmpR family, phosphate regulon response regulator PhoB
MEPADPRRALVVEDDDHVATALEFVLAREGLAVDRVAEGTEALSRIRRDRPALVLLDVMLPGLSGHEICREVRRDPALDGVRIIVLTARGSAEDRRRALDLGADAFVAKPFDIATLRAEMRRQLAREPSAKGSAG